VLSFRNYNPTNFAYLDKEWFLPLYRALLQSPSIVLSGNSRPANADYAAWLGVDPARVLLVPNSIDPQDFPTPSSADASRLREELGLPEDAPVILGVFRLSEEKDPRAFLRVCAAASRALPGLRVLIAGVGPLEEEIEKYAQALGIQDAVTLLGLRRDVPALMSIASLVLLTSTHEGMPNVLMEAQLLGVPVVATRVGGTPDVVVDGATGYLRPVGDIDGLTHACLAILRNGELRRAMAAAGRKRMSETFSRQSMVDAFAALASMPESRAPQADVASQAAAGLNSG
jgi:glycosyltransferase involved in cell wall biosynthesis